MGNSCTSANHVDKTDSDDPPESKRKAEKQMAKLTTRKQKQPTASMSSPLPPVSALDPQVPRDISTTQSAFDARSDRLAVDDLTIGSSSQSANALLPRKPGSIEDFPFSRFNESRESRRATTVPGVEAIMEQDSESEVENED